MSRVRPEKDSAVSTSRTALDRHRVSRIEMIPSIVVLSRRSGKVQSKAPRSHSPAIFYARQPLFLVEVPPGGSLSAILKGTWAIKPVAQTAL